MKKVAMSIAVLALIGETQAVKLAWGVESTYDDTYGQRYSFAQSTAQKEDEAENQTEADAKAAEIAGAANASAVNDVIRADQESKAAAADAQQKFLAARAASISNVDGLIHNADGTVEFPAGGVVNGVNNLTQGQASVENEDGEINEAVDIARALAHTKDYQKEDKLMAQKSVQAYEQRISNAHAHFDGLYHAADGHVEFVDGGVLSGVNEEIILPKPTARPIGEIMAERQITAYQTTMEIADSPMMAQTSQRQKDDDDTIAEAEKKNGEVGGAANEAVQNEKGRQATDAANKAKAEKDAQIADAQKRFNPYEGFYHNNDGTKTHFDGTPLNGVNEWIQTEGQNMNQIRNKKHHHHHKHHFDNDYLMVRPTTLQEDTAKFLDGGDYNSSLDKDALRALQQESSQFEAKKAQDAQKALVKKQTLAVKVEVQGTYNEFDGLYHGPEGQLYDATGMKVTGVNIALS